LSGIFWVGRGKYRPTTKSRKLPDGLFTCLVYLGNFPAHPRSSRPTNLHAPVFSPTRSTPCFWSWKADERGRRRDGGDRRRGKETAAGTERANRNGDDEILLERLVACKSSASTRTTRGASSPPPRPLPWSRIDSFSSGHSAHCLFLVRILYWCNLILFFFFYGGCSKHGCLSYTHGLSGSEYTREHNRWIKLGGE
jgi:hypothetical protein